ncbi:MAG: hypothetical protein ACREGE_03310 [Candidatus Microsaccharimonas sp.]
MSELLITSSLDPINEGDVFPKGLPRHVTIWQYFKLPDFRREAFAEQVGSAVQGFSPLEILGIDNAEFGPNNDVPVRRVQTLGSGATLIALHAVLGEIIQRNDGEIRNPEWAFENFNPHITYVEGRAIQEGELARLSTVELVEVNPTSKDKIIRNVWELEEV